MGNRIFTQSQSIPWAFPNGPVVKNLPANVGDMGSIPGLGRSPGEGNGNPLQYSCLGNPMDRGAWWATVRGGVTKESNTTDYLNNNNKAFPTDYLLQEDNWSSLYRALTWQPPT